MKKKFLSSLLCLCMVLALLPSAAMAADASDAYSYPYLKNVQGIEYIRSVLKDDNISEEGSITQQVLEVYDAIDLYLQNNGDWEKIVSPLREAFRTAGFTEKPSKNEDGDTEYWYSLDDTALTGQGDLFIIMGETFSHGLFNESGIVSITHYYIAPSQPTTPVPGLSNFTKSVQYVDNQFTDVSSSKWYSSAVKTAFELGLMKGNSNTKFNPSGNITIAETLALACRMHQIYNGGTGNFNQGTPWYQVYVDYALENGIITASQFANYKAVATRAEFATILAAAFPKSALPAINSVARIPDVSTSASYSQPVYLLYNAGILTGSDKFGTFHPDSSIARSEAAAIVTRMAIKSERKSFELQIDSSSYVISDFRRIKNKYSHAVAVCGYGYGYTNIDGDLCVLTVIQYKITSSFSEVTLHNLTTGDVISDPEKYYDDRIELSYGANRLHYYDLKIELLNNTAEMYRAISEILRTGKNPWKGISVDLKYLNW